MFSIGFKSDLKILVKQDRKSVWRREFVFSKLRQSVLGISLFYKIGTVRMVKKGQSKLYVCMTHSLDSRILRMLRQSGQSNSQTVRQSDSHTVVQSDSRKIRQSDSRTVRQSENRTVRQSDSQTVGQSHSRTVGQSHSRTVI